MRWLVVVACLISCGAPAPATPPPAGPSSLEPPAADPPMDAVAPPIEGAWQDLGLVGDAHHPPRRLRAWVPAVADDAPLPSLLVLDGDGAEDFFALPETIGALGGEGRIRPPVVLALSSTAARDDELSRADTRFVDFLADAVLPHARRALPLSSERRDTAILGYSYGGLQAANAVVRRPEVFGIGIAQSPSLWVADRALTSRFRSASAPVPARLWIDVGTDEPDPEELIRYMVRDARAFRDAAIARGMIWGRNLGYLEALGEGHDMRAGGRRMREALLFALGDVDLTAVTPVSLRIARHGSVRGRSAFSIELGYDGGARLTVPRQLAEVLSGGAPLRGEIASVARPLLVRTHGLAARAD